MTPPLDEDSFQEGVVEAPSGEPEYPVIKEYRELRSSTRALAVSIIIFVIASILLHIN